MIQVSPSNDRCCSQIEGFIERGCLTLNFGGKRLLKLVLTSSTRVGGHVGFDAYADLHRSQRSWGIAWGLDKKPLAPGQTPDMMAFPNISDGRYEVMKGNDFIFCTSRKKTCEFSSWPVIGDWQVNADNMISYASFCPRAAPQLQPVGVKSCWRKDFMSERQSLAIIAGYTWIDKNFPGDGRSNCKYIVSVWECTKMSWTSSTFGRWILFKFVRLCGFEAPEVGLIRSMLSFESFGTYFLVEMDNSLNGPNSMGVGQACQK